MKTGGKELKYALGALLIIGLVITSGWLVRKSAGGPSPTIEEVIGQNRTWLMGQEGVINLGIGEVDGEPCIKIYVREKTQQLERSIPKEIEGYKVILEVVGAIVEDENSASMVENDINLTVTLQKTEFYLGENIPVNLTLTNERDENAFFTFSSGYQFDILVFNENFERICAWSDGKVFIQALTGFTLRPGESCAWDWNWDQTSYNRATGKYSFVGSGTYYLRGTLVGYMETPLLKIVILTII
jgi:hypothetical protein